MKDLVCGVGVNDRKYSTRVNDKIFKEYNIWVNLLKRCYTPKGQKKQPTYVGCSVSENFKNYSYFRDWCQTQIGFGQQDFQLDKDLIFKGNKVYSEETCLFLPRDLNNLFTSRKNCRGALPIGVYAQKGRFKVRCCSNLSERYLGYFNTPEEAFATYKQAKEAFIRLQAEKWRAFIDPRAFKALMNYEVSITD